MTPTNPVMIQSPSQTIGPYFAQGLLRKGDGFLNNILITERTEGERIRIEGRVMDGEGGPVEDAMIEIWQANRHGRYRHPLDEQDKPFDTGFIGHGRTATDINGFYWFETIKPGSIPGPNNAIQAPHINTVIFARGMSSHVFTRIYFENDAANQDDPVLKNIANKKRRKTLIATASKSVDRIVYRFDIHLQGPKETVFFDA